MPTPNSEEPEQEQPEQEQPELKEEELHFAQVVGREEQFILRLNDGAFIPNDPSNADFAAFQQWLAKGNKLDPAPMAAPEPHPTTLAADPVHEMDAVTRRYLDKRLDEMSERLEAEIKAHR